MKIFIENDYRIIQQISFGELEAPLIQRGSEDLPVTCDKFIFASVFNNRIVFYVCFNLKKLKRTDCRNFIVSLEPISNFLPMYLFQDSQYYCFSFICAL